ncbi:hypothetical protein CBG50_09820 [Fusobacterium polymorphum]|uniref:MotA/TolQ/ExbB proton channel domain-containing protein n=1 Tax=Fusobacterium nucleatum subsp. polymorphum TaxID=76857 RepID=A0A1Z3CJR8_FUSNP|nr:hypothetical protein [Fusobacterium polymorphum]ASC03540.1 hypothetical protein CBG50_09820 [Fusobacterium polymorphum]
MEENKKFSMKKIAIIIITVIILIVAIIFKLKYDIGGAINTAFFLLDVAIFLGFMGVRIYKDWKIKEEMYYLNQELKKVSSTYITQEEYQKISNDFLEGKYSTLKEEWDSFAESVFFENDVAFQTVDAELFFNDSTLLKERINKRLLDYIPQLLLAIGIFGTFFGLVLGLSGLDLSAGDNTQLNNLINGTKISFLTSLYGMYFSIAISSLMNFHIGDYEENILKIKNNLNRVFKQALAEKSLIKIEKELGMIESVIGEIKGINKGMSVAIGQELISVIQSYNETNEKYMVAVTKIVKANLSGLAESVSSLFEEKMKRIFSEEFVSKFENLNRNTLEIATNNNRNIEEYKNEIAKISNSISITNETLTSFCNGALKNYETVVEKYDERFNSILNLIDNSKQNYQEFLTLLKESSNVLKVSNKYISKTDDTFKLINKFLEQENSLVSFWEQNKEIVSNLNQNLENFFDKYQNGLNNLNISSSNHLEEVQKSVVKVQAELTNNMNEFSVKYGNNLISLNEKTSDNFEKIYSKLGGVYEELRNKIDDFIVKYENNLAKLNQEYDNNLVLVNNQVETLFKNYDSNLSSIVLNFNNMIENLKITLKDINNDKIENEKVSELSKKLLDLIDEIEDLKNKKNNIEIQEIKKEIEG